MDRQELRSFDITLLLYVSSRQPSTTCEKRAELPARYEKRAELPARYEKCAELQARYEKRARPPATREKRAEAFFFLTIN